MLPEVEPGPVLKHYWTTGCDIQPIHTLLFLQQNLVQSHDIKKKFESDLSVKIMWMKLNLGLMVLWYVRSCGDVSKENSTLFVRMYSTVTYQDS
jgi:hypothetical protein